MAEDKLDAVPREMVEEVLGLFTSPPMRKMAALDLWASQNGLESDIRSEFVTSLCRLAASTDNPATVKRYVEESLAVVVEMGPILIEAFKRSRSK
jgi:hypothetical protein